MKHLFFSLCVAFMMLTSSVSNASEIAAKKVTLDEFMQGSVLGKINVPVIVPTEFEPAVLPKANFGYVYWMNPNDVSASNSSGSLPEQNGYMYGKITPNVGYDARKDIFIGLEDPESIERARRQMAGLTIARYKFGPHAIVLLSYAIGNKLAYLMYVATNIDTNVVYIALRPPGNSQEIGEAVWKHLKSTLERVSSEHK